MIKFIWLLKFRQVFRLQFEIAGASPRHTSPLLVLIEMAQIGRKGYELTCHGCANSTVDQLTIL